ncbi:MAG: tRNA pseudouridine(38-40) synthase TruA [Bacteroidota bacterium]
MRYFAELAYKGTNFHGWQRQPNAPSVQATLEEALSTILRTSITITGCGRTDTGVHASQYYIHFDTEVLFPKAFEKRINKYLPDDIAVYKIFGVDDKAHARFDATYRAYEYHVIFGKNPFLAESAYRFPFGEKLDFEKMQDAAKLLLNYDAFFPFCKTKSDAKTMLCNLHRAEWIWKIEGKHLVFRIAANRFLRGMVRLIVGMCLNVGIGKLSIDEVEAAMHHQTRLRKSYSVPPQGLFLSEVRYSYPRVESD